MRSRRFWAVSNRTGNPVVRLVLRSPLHRLLSRRTALITVTRRSSSSSAATGIRSKWRLRRTPTRRAAAWLPRAPVGSRYISWLRRFRYEVRCWGGLSPDLGESVGASRRLTSDPRVARRLLDPVVGVPRPVWGHDELKAGGMWNSNSVIAWLIATGGLPLDPRRQPPRGRAPGWFAGLEVARRGGASDRGHAVGARYDRGAARATLETAS